MVRLGWDATFSPLVEPPFRVLQNENYDIYHYSRYHEFTLGYSRPWKGAIVGGEIGAGKDAFGYSSSRGAGYIRYDDTRSGIGAIPQAFSYGGAGGEDKSGEIFL